MAERGYVWKTYMNHSDRSTEQIEAGICSTEEYDPHQLHYEKYYSRLD